MQMKWRGKIIIMQVNRIKRLAVVFSSLMLGISALQNTILAEEVITEEQEESVEEAANDAENTENYTTSVEKTGSGEVIIEREANPVTGIEKATVHAVPSEGWHTLSLDAFDYDGNSIVYSTGENWISFFEDRTITVKAVFEEDVPYYTFTFAEDPHVTFATEVNGVESIRAKQGDSVVVAAETESGFSVKEFYAVCSYEEGTEGPAVIPFLSNPAKFEMPVCDMEIHAVIETARHDICLVNHDLARGIAEVNGKQVHSGACGETVTVKLSYDAKEFRSDGICVEASDGTLVETEMIDPYTYTFVMPEDDVKIRVREKAVTVKDENGDTYVIDSYRALSPDVVDLTDGWWVADTDITLNSRVCVGKWDSTLAHHVNLFLKDGVTVTFASGIQTDSGTNAFHMEHSTLDIWGGEKGDGQLIAYGTPFYDAIGSEDALPFMEGGKVSIHGGIITADGREGRYGITGTGTSVNIYGGTVNAYGGKTGAAISAHVGIVNIYGGTVNAEGRNYHAGISTGKGAWVNIFGGTVNAHGDSAAAGIGGDEDNGAGWIRIYGGNVNAYGGGNRWDGVGAGIGGGDEGYGGHIFIYGGTIHAESPFINGVFDDWQGAGIGGGNDANGGNITIEGGTIDAHGWRGIGYGNGSDGEVNITLGDRIKVDGFDYSERYHVLSYGKDIWMSEIN